MPLELDPEIAAALLPGDPPPLDDWKSRRDGAPADFAAFDARRAAPTGVSAQDFTIIRDDGTQLLVRWYTSSSTTPGPAALYLHGGSMILGSVDLYDGIVRTYVAESSVPILAVDYRLSPEHPYPAPLEDCYAALVWLAEHADPLGVDPARVAVMGDSAGGGLSAAVALLARDRGGPAIARQILIYPMLDDRPLAVDPALAAATFTYDDNATGWNAYLGGATRPREAAPARATDLTGLPPLYLDVGQLDIPSQRLPTST